MTATAKEQPPEAAPAESVQQALEALERTVAKYRGCSDSEKAHLRDDVLQLRRMIEKLTKGQVELAVFGEISTGKSALINALVGSQVTQVDVQGGWTKDVWHIDWDGAGYCVPGLAESRVVLVDTPGLNEVGGANRGDMACEAAQQADLILFVTDSDLNETEHSALAQLATVHKPILVVLNKMDLYSRDQRARLTEVLSEDRLVGIVPPENIVATSADPREMEYVVEAADGSTRSQWRKPEPDVEALKARILEVLVQDGLALLTLNAALYAADKSDRIASLRVELRRVQAMTVISSYAGLKALAVALNPWGVADVLGGGAIDAAMVVTLAHIYGLEMSWTQSHKLALSILHAAGWMMAGEVAVSFASSAFKVMTGGLALAVTAVPQGAAAGFGSYIVGRAAQQYFEQGSSWGRGGPKSVIREVLEKTDKQSVLSHLKEEIQRKIRRNPHAKR